MLGRWGVKGIRGNFRGDGRPLGLRFGLPGGVEKRVSLVTLRGLFSDGELRKYFSILFFDLGA